MSATCVCKRPVDTELIAGPKCCTWCPQWKAECLERDTAARIVLRIGSIEARRRWLADYRKNRGDLAGDRLEATVKRIWETR